MAIDPAAPSSRRALLAASLGGLAAVTAQALGRPLAANAADGATVVVGDDTLTGTSVTKITTTGDTAFWGASTSSNGVVGEGPTGVHGYGGQYGVQGDAGGNGVGVYGTSESGYAVHAESAYGHGVMGWSNFGEGSGVIGISGGGYGDLPSKTGVYGFSAADAASRGVAGQSTSGQGVRGVASSGRGVHGQATSGTGVYATATTGTALRVVGRAKFDDCAGVATIASGTKSVTVTPGVDLVSTSAVVATLMGSAGGTTNVHRVSVSTTANTFTIYLTANSTAAVKVAWHVFG